MKLLTWAHYALVAEDFENVNVENAEAELETGGEHLDDSKTDDPQKKEWSVFLPSHYLEHIQIYILLYVICFVDIYT